MPKLRFSIGTTAALVVVVLVLLIALVTAIAWSVINRTVVDQFRASELQLVTSLSQQAEASLNNLNSNIATLGLQQEIRSTSQLDVDEALNTLAFTEVFKYPEGSIISITRFDHRGYPRYAWPGNLNASISTLKDRMDFKYAVPQEFVDRTRGGQRVTSSIPIHLRQVERSDGGGKTYLLIAPVDASNLNTEYLVYELDLGILFQDLFDFVELGDSGQLWVLTNNGEVLFQARSSPTPDSAPALTRLEDLSDYDEPVNRTYEAEGDTRLASVASTNALSSTFIIFLTRSQSEAQAGVTNNIISIFVFSSLAAVLVIGMATLLIRRIAYEQQKRQQEEQRQQTTSTMLEVARALNSSLDLSIVLERILAELQKLVPHDSAAVLLLEDMGLRTVAEHSTRGGKLTTTIFRPDEARAAREVIAMNHPIVINDTSKDERWTDVPGIKIRSWIGLPLRVRDHLVGVLNINDEEPNRFTAEDVDVAQAFADQASIALQNARLYQLEVKQIEQELIIARGIQETLLPEKSPELPQLQVVVRSLAAQQVSGDYYLFLPLRDGKWLFAIGDVQGKGIPAALMMAVIMTALRDEAVRHNNPADLLQALNTRLLQRMVRNHMNTGLMFAIFDSSTYQFEVANGGMLQPYVRYAGSDKFDFVPVGGYPLGVSGTMKYASKTVPFQTGSMMLMFTDGVVEAQNRVGEFLGFEKVEALLDSFPVEITPEEALDRILEAVQIHLDGLPPQDDTTIIVFRAQEVKETMSIQEPEPEEGHTTRPIIAVPASMVEAKEKTAEARSSTHSDANRYNVELFIPSQLGFEMIARSAVESMAREVGFEEERIEDIKTAVAEACMNAIEHGNAMDITRSVGVLLSASEAGLEIRVMDTGMKTLPQEVPSPGQGDMRGWGLFFMQNLMDEFEIRYLPEGGNVIHMVSYLKTDNAGDD
ncbi:MAG: SpoIIE family protein phosphatase [Anaerolineae bacterium]|nr:SpoIIE family protein phosphatase [Anaerolineae bacterium]